MSKKIIIILFSFSFLSYFSLNYLIGKDYFSGIKNLFGEKEKKIIKEYLFPYKEISLQKKEIENKKKIIHDQKKILDQKNLKIHDLNATTEILKQFAPGLEEEIDFKKQLGNIGILKKDKIVLSNNLKLSKYMFLDGFYSGIHNVFPGSGYIDFHFKKQLRFKKPL